MATLSKAQKELLRTFANALYTSDRVRDFRNARTCDSLERMGLVRGYTFITSRAYDVTEAGENALLS